MRTERSTQWRWSRRRFAHEAKGQRVMPGRAFAYDLCCVDHAGEAGSRVACARHRSRLISSPHPAVYIGTGIALAFDMKSGGSVNIVGSYPPRHVDIDGNETSWQPRAELPLQRVGREPGQQAQHARGDGVPAAGHVGR